jgi:hypothetical protein
MIGGKNLPSVNCKETRMVSNIGTKNTILGMETIIFAHKINDTLVLKYKICLICFSLYI